MTVMFPLFVLLTLVASIYSFWKPTSTLPLFIIAVAVADLAKRLLWLPVEANPSSLEYQLTLVLPDFIMLTGAARVMYDLLIRQSITYTFHWLDVPIGLYFTWSFLSILNPETSLFVGIVGFKSTNMYIVVYILVRLYQSTYLDLLDRIKYPLLGGALLASIYGLYQAAFGFTDFEHRWLASGQASLGTYNPEGENLTEIYGYTLALGNIVRVFSFFASHEQMGFFLASALLLLFLYPVRWQWRVVLATILVFAMMRTLSRSSWAYFISGWLVLFVGTFVFQKRKQVGYLLFVAVVMLVAYLAWENTNDDTEFSGRATEAGTLEFRIYTIEAFIEEPSWRKPLGNGVGSMWTAWRLDAPGTEGLTADEIDEQGYVTEEKRLLSHIGLVDIVYELGMVGFWMFIWLMMAISWYSWKVLYHDENDYNKRVVLASLSIILGIVAVNSTFATLFNFRPINTVFWLAVGLVAMVTLPKVTETSTSKNAIL